MIKNFIAEVIHATKYLKAKRAEVEKDLTVNGETTLKTLTVDKIIDNGKVYGSTAEVKELTLDPNKNKNDEGSIEKPARIDHTHKIPVPHTFKIKSHDGKSVTEYNTQSDKEVTINPDFAGAAKKNHKDTSTDYGKGDGTYYGHVKLTDSGDSSKDENGGYAATPKAVSVLKTAIDKCLPLSGGTMTGTIVTPTNSVGLKIGNRTEILDDSNENAMIIRNAVTQTHTKIGIGYDKSTILISYKGDGSLYLNNNSDSLAENDIFLPIRERAIVDYTVEQVLTATGDWVPERSGNYRIYIIGGGGSGSDGAYSAQNIKDNTYYDDNGNEKYGTDYEGNGFVISGYGGGGGGVCVIDIVVDPSTPPYEISYVNDTVEGEAIEYESLVPVRRFATFTFGSGKSIVATGLDSLSGGEYFAEDKTTVRVYAGSDSTAGEISYVKSGTDAEGHATYGWSWYDSDGNLNSKYVGKIAELGGGSDYLAPSTKPSYPPFGSVKRWKRTQTVRGLFCGDHYHLKDRNVWKKYTYPGGVYVNKADLNDTNMALEYSGVENTTELKDLLDGDSISNYLKNSLTDINSASGEVREYVEFMYDQTKFASKIAYIKYATPGVGGFTECLTNNFDYNEYYGGNGDESIAKDISSSYADKCIATDSPRRAFGYGGGIPGNSKYLGIVGGGGASGGIKYVKPKGYFYGETLTGEKDGVRSGTGGSLYLREIGGYCGVNDSSLKPSSSSGGGGYYGGGGGGGAAIICGNGSGKSTGTKTGGGAGGKACVIIVHLGNNY